MDTSGTSKIFHMIMFGGPIPIKLLRLVVVILGLIAVVYFGAISMNKIQQDPWADWKVAAASYAGGELIQDSARFWCDGSNGPSFSAFGFTGNIPGANCPTGPKSLYESIKELKEKNPKAPSWWLGSLDMWEMMLEVIVFK